MADVMTDRYASLATVNYEGLVNKDPAEIEKLATAGKTRGMWYVDLRGPRTKTFFEDVPLIFKTGYEFFSLPQECEEKVKAIRWGLDRGHDKMDRGYHTSEDYHYYEIAINEYLSDRWNLPATIEGKKEIVNRAIKVANDAAQLILAELCTAAGVTLSDLPELGADLSRDSDTCFKLVYKPAVHNAGGVVIPWHTDFGILTFLWYDDATTQVPVYKDGVQTDEFETVAVKDGCVLVYVSDDLATKSGGRLHPATHRVVAPPGEKREKNGLVYMIRPYKD